MDILKPFKGLELRVIHDELGNFNQEIAKLKNQKHEEIADYLVSCFKNYKFTKQQMKRYEDDIYEFVADLTMINNIKQAYQREKDSNYEFLEVAYEEYDESGNIYTYNGDYTPDFEEVQQQIEELYSEYSGDNCFSDMTNMCILLPTKRYYDMLEYELEYTEDYHCRDLYRIRKVYYKVVLALEQLMIKNKDKLINLINKEIEKY